MSIKLCFKWTYFTYVHLKEEREKKSPMQIAPQFQHPESQQGWGGRVGRLGEGQVSKSCGSQFEISVSPAIMSLYRNRL